MQWHVAQRDVVHYVLPIAPDQAQRAAIIGLPRQSALLCRDARNNGAAMRRPPESCPEQRQHHDGCRCSEQDPASPRFGKRFLATQLYDGIIKQILGQIELIEYLLDL